MRILLKNPAARKPLQRFRRHRLAVISFRILLVLYLISLGSELICNNIPLYVRFNGQSCFPLITFYAEDVFLHNGRQTRPDYKAINRTALFRDHPSNFMVFPPIPYGPYESVDPASLSVAETVRLTLSPVRRIATVNIAPDYTIERANALESFLPEFAGNRRLKDLRLADYFRFPDEVKQAIVDRFANQKASRLTFQLERIDGVMIDATLSTFTPRSSPPRTVRLMFRETEEQKAATFEIVLDTDHRIKGKLPDPWYELSERLQKDLLEQAIQRFDQPVEVRRFRFKERWYEASFGKTRVQFPFPPVQGHWLGIDSAGRDVLARILYGLRISLTFGLLLVGCSMILGIVTGAVQGYFGGWMDITFQRFIEIWSALPFLYIMILMGSIYGRSFALLLFCYGIFNWIGISYYIRAEFLRLRKQPFVEAAKVMGLSARKIIFRHILPNAMIPVITFFPFSLVGAIGSLAALDYLGFGLPPPTPSWGELLFQAQQYRWAWWLILYPSLALFGVMLMGVFIGEGIRNAYDPKRYVRLQ
jgi:microcin C transport system permease protein